MSEHTNKSNKFLSIASITSFDWNKNYSYKSTRQNWKILFSKYFVILHSRVIYKIIYTNKQNWRKYDSNVIHLRGTWHDKRVRYVFLLTFTWRGKVTQNKVGYIVPSYDHFQKLFFSLCKYKKYNFIAHFNINCQFVFPLVYISPIYRALVHQSPSNLRFL